MLIPAVHNKVREIYSLNAELLFNRAISRLKMSDTSGFCNFLYDASQNLDSASDQYYCTYCLSQTVNRIYYDRKFKVTSNTKRARYLQITRYDKYRKIGTGELLDLNRKGKFKMILVTCGKYDLITEQTIAKYMIINHEKVYHFLKPVDYVSEGRMLQSQISKLLNYPEDKKVAKLKYGTKKIEVDLSLAFDKEGKLSDVDLLNLYPKNVDLKYFNEAKIVATLAASNWINPHHVIHDDVKTVQFIEVVFTLGDK